MAFCGAPGLPSGLPRLEALREELAMARAALEQLEPKAEALRLLWHKAQVVCGHGDFKPSNIIEHEGEANAIAVDSEAPCGSSTSRWEAPTTAASIG